MHRNEAITMRPLTQLKSEPILCGGSKVRTSIPIKRSSTSIFASSYKLSSQVRKILSKELQRPSSFDSDESVQPMNPRRKFQRRGSKSPSMFRALSADQFQIKLSELDSDQEEQADKTEMLIQAAMDRVSNDSTSSCELSLGESLSTISSHGKDSAEFV